MAKGSVVGISTDVDGASVRASKWIVKCDTIGAWGLDFSDEVGLGERGDGGMVGVRAGGWAVARP